MDTSQTVNCVEWFFGYGGNHLGLKRVIPSLRCIAACEIEAYAIANLVSKMEAGCLDVFPVWSNVKTFPCEQFRGLVDIFIASYPCQGFSSAGQRKGEADPRFLWPWVFQAVTIIQPRLCFFENVDGHVSLGLSTVISDLEAAGYKVAEGVFSAAEVGAPQSRKRVFILGIRKDMAHSRLRDWPTWGPRNQLQQKPSISELAGSCCELADAESTEPGNLRSGNETEQPRPSEHGFGTGLADDQREGHQRPECEGLQRESGEPSRHRIGSCKLADDNDVRLRQDSNQSELRTTMPEQSPCNCGASKQGETFKIPRPFFWPDFVARPGEQQRDFEPPRVIKVERGLGGGVDGRSSNVDRLRLLGNGVYPAVAAKAFVTLFNRFTE